MQTAWRYTACWLALQGLLNLLFYSTQDHLPRGDTAELGWALPSQVISREWPPDLPQANLMGAVFPGVSRLCKADRSI